MTVGKLMFGAACSAVVLCAQQLLPGPPIPLGGAPQVEAVRQMSVAYVAAEGVAPGSVVKGAPYSAQAVTESTQSLADGNRIRHSNTAQVYRDSAGRTRREASLGIGLAPDADIPQLIFITDPEAGVQYVLDSKARTAQKSKLISPADRIADLRPKLGPETGVPGEKFEMHLSTDGPVAGGVRAFAYRIGSEDPPKTETLRRQMIEGVQAEGTRTVHSIPAGKIGNDRPIEIVSERWYSPELQVVVMSKHSDPRMGETTYRLTNISRAEPARTLFDVPSDFTVTESNGGDVLMKVRRPE